MKRGLIILLVVLGVPMVSYSQVNNDTMNTEQTRFDSIKTQIKTQMEKDSLLETKSNGLKTRNLTLAK